MRMNTAGFTTLTQLPFQPRMLFVRFTAYAEDQMIHAVGYSVRGFA
jgi:hypothetical protein